MTLLFSQRIRTYLALSAGLLIAVAFAVRILGAPGSSDVLLVAASLIAGTPIAARAWQGLRHRAFSIDLLVTIAVVGALVIGEYVESAVVSFLFLFGAWLEARSMERTRASLRDLIDLAPQQVTVLRDGERVVVDADELQEGETILIFSGESVGADGVIDTGTARVSEAAITGEPIPVSKGPGDRVFAGTVLDQGFITVTAEQVGDETTYARIIELVEEAQESKTARQRFLDRFSQFYTPAIVIIAIIALFITRDLSFSLTFLVIACPGALVISIPVAAVAGLGNVAKHGTLIKDSESLEMLAGANVMVVDKTGTVTKGHPSVTSVHPAAGYSARQLLHWAGSLELASEHHLGRAVVRAALEEELILSDPENAQIVAGLGVIGQVDGKTILVGSADYALQSGINLGEELVLLGQVMAQQGATPLFVVADGFPIGLLGVADPVRRDAASAISRLRKQGIKKIVMLTGDRTEVGNAVAAPLGIDEVHGGLLPAEKATAIKQMQDRGLRVAMVGDGVNDAPSLALAEVGIAMGGTGTDISIESADIVLLTDRLDQLAHAHRVAKSTLRIMKQNMALALGTVGILIAGVLLGAVNLAGGMLVHEVSVLLVVLNALRLTYLRGPSASRLENTRNVVAKAKEGNLNGS